MSTERAIDQLVCAIQILENRKQTDRVVNSLIFLKKQLAFVVDSATMDGKVGLSSNILFELATAKMMERKILV